MRFLERFLGRIKNNADIIAISFIVYAIVIFVLGFVLSFFGSEIGIGLFASALGLLSIGLGLVAIDMSAKSDERQTELLERLDRNVARLPYVLKGDTLTPSEMLEMATLGPLGLITAKEMLSEQSKPAAQKRLDEDTQRVGYVRGELFQNEDDSWSIHWGGKYPL